MWTLIILTRSENRRASVVSMAGARVKIRVRIFECSEELLQGLLRDLEKANIARERIELYSVVVEETKLMMVMIEEMPKS